MSLINKMLKDLEARQTGAAPRTDARPIFHDLQPTGGERRVRSLAAGSLLVVVIAAGGFFAWQQYAQAPRTQLAGVATPTAIPPAVETVPVVADSSATPVPAASSPAPVVKPAAAKPEASKPAPAKTPAAPQPVAKPKAATARAPKAEPEAEARIEKIERTPNPQELAENLYREAARVHAQGNPSEAERLLKTLLVSNPRHTLARERLAGIQLDGGRWTEAQDTLEQGVAQVPQHLPFRYSLARIHLERGNLAEAEKLLDDARRAGHTDAELHAFLAAVHQRASKHGDAIKSYREALTLRPEEGRWWVGLGISLEAQQEAGTARDAYRRALDTGRLPANLARYAEDRIKALVVTR